MKKKPHFVKVSTKRSKILGNSLRALTALLALNTSAFATAQEEIVQSNGQNKISRSSAKRKTKQSNDAALVLEEKFSARPELLPVYQSFLDNKFAEKGVRSRKKFEKFVVDSNVLSQVRDEAGFSNLLNRYASLDVKAQDALASLLKTNLSKTFGSQEDYETLFTSLDTLKDKAPDAVKWLTGLRISASLQGNKMTHFMDIFSSLGQDVENATKWATSFYGRYPFIHKTADDLHLVLTMYQKLGDKRETYKNWINDAEIFKRLGRSSSIGLLLTVLSQLDGAPNDLDTVKKWLRESNYLLTCNSSDDVYNLLCDYRDLKGNFAQVAKWLSEQGLTIKTNTATRAHKVNRAYLLMHPEGGSQRRFVLKNNYMKAPILSINNSSQLLRLAEAHSLAGDQIGDLLGYMRRGSFMETLTLPATRIKFLRAMADSPEKTAKFFNIADKANLWDYHLTGNNILQVFKGALQDIEGFESSLKFLKRNNILQVNSGHAAPKLIKQAMALGKSRDKFSALLNRYNIQDALFDFVYEGNQSYSTLISGLMGFYLKNEDLAEVWVKFYQDKNLLPVFLSHISKLSEYSWPQEYHALTAPDERANSLVAWAAPYARERLIEFALSGFYSTLVQHYTKHGMRMEQIREIFVKYKLLKPFERHLESVGTSTPASYTYYSSHDINLLIELIVKNPSYTNRVLSWMSQAPGSISDNSWNVLNTMGLLWDKESLLEKMQHYAMSRELFKISDFSVLPFIKLYVSNPDNGEIKLDWLLKNNILTSYLRSIVSGSFSPNQKSLPEDADARLAWVKSLQTSENKPIFEDYAHGYRMIDNLSTQQFKYLQSILEFKDVRDALAQRDHGKEHFISVLSGMRDGDGWMIDFLNDDQARKNFIEQAIFNKPVPVGSQPQDSDIISSLMRLSPEKKEFFDMLFELDLKPSLAETRLILPRLEQTGKNWAILRDWLREINLVEFIKNNKIDNKKLKPTLLYYGYYVNSDDSPAAEYLRSLSKILKTNNPVELVMHGAKIFVLKSAKAFQSQSSLWLSALTALRREAPELYNNALPEILKSLKEQGVESVTTLLDHSRALELPRVNPAPVGPAGQAGAQQPVQRLVNPAQVNPARAAPGVQAGAQPPQQRLVNPVALGVPQVPQNPPALGGAGVRPAQGQIPNPFAPPAANPAAGAQPAGQPQAPAAQGAAAPQGPGENPPIAPNANPFGAAAPQGPQGNPFQAPLVNPFGGAQPNQPVGGIPAAFGGAAGPQNPPVFGGVGVRPAQGQIPNPFAPPAGQQQAGQPQAPAAQGAGVVIRRVQGNPPAVQNNPQQPGVNRGVPQGNPMMQNPQGAGVMQGRPQAAPMAQAASVIPAVYVAALGTPLEDERLRNYFDEVIRNPQLRGGVIRQMIAMLGEDNPITQRYLQLAIGYDNVNDRNSFLAVHQEMLQKREDQIEHKMVQFTPGVQHKLDIIKESRPHKAIFMPVNVWYSLFNQLQKAWQTDREALTQLLGNAPIDQLMTLRNSEVILGLLDPEGSLKATKNVSAHSQMLREVLQNIRGMSATQLREEGEVGPNLATFLQLLVNIQTCPTGKLNGIAHSYIYMNQGRVLDESVLGTEGFKKEIVDYFKEELRRKREATISMMLRNGLKLPNADPHDIYYIRGIIGSEVGLLMDGEVPTIDIHAHAVSQRVRQMSKQQMLDMFYQYYKVEDVIQITHDMLKNNTIHIAAGQKNLTIRVINEFLQGDAFDVDEGTYKDKYVVTNEKGEPTGLTLEAAKALLSMLGIIDVKTRQ